MYVILLVLANTIASTIETIYAINLISVSVLRLKVYCIWCNQVSKSFCHFKNNIKNRPISL